MELLPPPSPPTHTTFVAQLFSQRPRRPDHQTFAADRKTEVMNGGATEASTSAAAASATVAGGIKVGDEVRLASIIPLRTN